MDRPFNLKGGGGVWFFVSFRIFFFEQRELEYLFFLSRKAQKKFLISTLGYMTKILNQIIFFFLHQNQNFLLEKPKPKPLQAKWSFPNDINYSFCRKKTLFSAYDEFMLITQN